MRNSIFRYAWFVAAILSAGIACNTVSRVNEVKETAQSFATEARGFITQNADLLETARAFATDEGSQALGTLSAYATQEGPGLMETAKAFATEEGPGLLETARAFATQEGPGLLETGRALATENPGLVETVRAAVTEGVTNGEVPADIPLIERGQIDDYFASSQVISFSTTLDKATMMEFYQREMPLNGWEETSDNPNPENEPILLKFDKPDKTATVIITKHPIKDQTLVLINIFPR